MANLTKTEKYVALTYAKYFGKTATKGIIDDYVSIGKTSKILQQIISDADKEQYKVHGDDLQAEVHNTFQNLFSRNATNKELEKYVKVLEKGKDLPINSIVKKATKFDKDVYNNKQEIAEYVAKNGGAEIDLSKVTKANPIDVGSLTSLADLQAKIDALPDNDGIPSSFDGKTFTLTASSDTGSKFVGTEKGDIFKADSFVSATGDYLPTLNSSDELDGGAGKDTLNITSDDTKTAGGYEMASATIKNIETITIKGAAAVTADVSGSNITGLETISVLKSKAATVTAAATTDVNVSGASGSITVKGGKDVTITDATGGKAITIGDGVAKEGNSTGKITVTDTDNSGTNDIKVYGGTDVTVTATSKAATGDIIVGDTAKGTASGNVSVTQNLTTVDAAGLDNSGKTIAVNGGKTVTVTSNATTTNAATKAVVSPGSTIKQAAVTVNADNTTTSVTVNQTANATAVAAVEAKAAVAGTQVVTFTAMTVGQTVTVDGLTFTAAKSLTAAEVAAAFSNISATTHLPTTTDYQSAGGTVVNGTYSGQTSANFTTGAATGATVTYTQVVAGTGTVAAPTGTATATVAAGVTAVPVVTAVTGVAGVTTGNVIVNDNDTKSITTVNLDGYSTAALGSTTLGTTDLNALTTLSLANGTGLATVATSATTLGLTLNNVTGAIDLDGATVDTVKTLNLTTAVKDSATALTAAVVETLNVSGTNAVNLSTGTLTNLKTVTVAGTAGLTLDADDADKLTSVDASATSGKVTTVIDGDIATYKGGSGVDTLTVDAALTTTNVAKAITLGAGNDTITLGAITIGAGTIDGGADTDTISIDAAAAATASNNTTFAGKVTNFEQLTLTGATSDQTVDAAKLGNYNYVTVTAGNAAAATTTLTGLTSGATIALNDANDNTNANDTIVATIKDATLVANTSDVLNIAISAKASSATATAAADDNGTVTAAGVETINISVLDAVNEATVVGAPVGTKNAAPDTQKLTLQATSAKTITITGDTALNLTNIANTAVSLIDASTMTGNLTVQAAGTVASTIKGGSGNDTLSASDALSIAPVAQISTVTLGAFDTGDTITISGIATAGVSVVTGATATATVDSLVAAINGAAGKTVTAVNDNGVLTLTAITAGTGFTATAAVVDGGGTTVTTATVATPVANAAASGLATTANILEGGAGNDSLTANAGMVKMYGGAGNDTFNITTASINVNSAATIMDLSSGDVIKFAGADSFKAAGITLDSTAVFQDYANAAIASITTNNDLAWFQYSGNTYIIQEKNAGTNPDVFVNAEDFVVKINGLVDLSTASFNASQGTLEIA